jgi:poly(3-hydroxybutyrate) depolymerase
VGVAGTGGASANAASTSECGNAPSALVGLDLKLAVGKLTATAEGPVTVCAYTGRYEVLVRYQTGETTAEFTQARTSQAGLHQAVDTVNGLGDAAYLASYTVRKPFSYTLGARQGDIAIFITSPVALSAESTLMTDLLKKV